MKRHTIFNLITTILLSQTQVQAQVHGTNSVETIKVLVRDISSNELAGANFRKRARGFYLLSGEDTSKFLCILKEQKNGQVFMELRWTTTKTFSQQLDELKQLLPESKKEFAFDSLKFIEAGLLFEMGDMDIQVTKDILTASKNDYNINEKQAAKYLMETQLAREFNSLLKPFDLRITKFEIPDHAYFNKGKYLVERSKGTILNGSKLMTPLNRVPKTLFDCDIRIQVGKM